MKKQFLSLLLALTLCLGLLPAVALAENRVATDGAITFNMDVADFGSLEYGYREEDCPTLTVTLTNSGDRSLWYIYWGRLLGENGEFSPHTSGEGWDDIHRYVNPPRITYTLELKPGSSASVELTLTTGYHNGRTSFPARVYEGDLEFYFSNTGEPTGWSYNDPVFADGAYYTLPYHFEVTYDGYMGGEDPMALDRESLDFGVVEIGDSVTRTLSVTNVAQVELDLSARLSESGQRLTLPEIQWTLAPGETAQIRIVLNGDVLNFAMLGQNKAELELSSYYCVSGGGDYAGYGDKKVVPITFTAVEDGCLPVFVELESPRGPSGYFTSADGSTTYWGNDNIDVPYGGDLTLKLVPFDRSHGYILAVEGGNTYSEHSYMGYDSTLQIRNVTDRQFYRVTIASCAVPPADWAREAVGRAYSAGIFHPFDMPYGWLDDRTKSAGPDGSMPSASYAAPISREDFCELAMQLYRKVDPKGASALPDPDEDRKNLLPSFTDMSKYAYEVRQLAYLGVITGTGDGRFNPDGELTREQAATILSRLAGVLGIKLPAAEPAFDDNGSISSWARDAVGQMQAAGIMGGVGNNQFGPQGTYSWEQSIVTLMRLYDMVAL